ncbi:MAG: TolC family protein, partial [Acidobacteriota bacterium]
MGITQVRQIIFWAAVSVLLPATGLSAELQAQAAAQTEFQTADPQLEQYINEALDRNPSVRQSFSSYQAALARLPQAGALPDPMLGFTQFLRTPETRVGAQTNSLSFSQQIPWFGKLDDKEDVAAKEAAIVREQYEARRDEIIRQVKLAYYDLGYVDRAIAITGEDLSLLRHYETLAQARYSQGVGLQQAVVKLQAEITRDLNRLEQLRTRRVDAEAVLNALRDLPADTPVPSVPQV